MQHKGFDKMPCPIARSLERVGEWWSILILRDAFRGLTRFDQFQKSLGIAPNMLTRRLTALVEAELLERRRYSEHPPRDEYVLTARGRDFRPVIVALLVGIPLGMIAAHRRDKASDAGTVMKTTAAGAGIGAIAGRSGTGTAIGAGVGAAAGLAAVLLSRGPEAELPRGSTLEAVIERPILLDADKVQFATPGQSSTLAGPPNREAQRTRVPF